MIRGFISLGGGGGGGGQRCLRGCSRLVSTTSSSTQYSHTNNNNRNNSSTIQNQQRLQQQFSWMHDLVSGNSLAGLHAMKPDSRRRFPGYNNRLSALLSSNLTSPSSGTRRLFSTLSSYDEHQQGLKKLPVPSLEETIPKYLKSVRPLLDDEEFKVTTEIAKKFAQTGGIGPRLQEYLLQRYKNKDNWFADWWMEMAYLGYRDPVTIYSSPGVSWKRRRFTSLDDYLEFAGGVASGALDYKIKLDTGMLELEFQQENPLDMQQFYKLFGTCRIPGQPVDLIQHHPTSKHIVVFTKNHPFKVQVYSEGGVPLTRSQLTDSIKQIVHMAESLESCEGVGVLTSQNRDLWYKDHAMLNEDCRNKETLETIQSALFVLSLDGEVVVDEELDDDSASALLALHGGDNISNRWFDKTLNFYVSRSGYCGLTYEHSPAEGPPVQQMTDHIFDHIKNDESILPAQQTVLPLKLEWNFNNNVSTSIVRAKENAKKMCDNVEMSVLHFKHFGKNGIKGMGFSPDSFVQIAIQTTFQRLEGVPGAHYESGSTRQFKDGRTEVIRTCSIESKLFGEAITKAPTSIKTLDLMRNAIVAHNAYAKSAVAGKGVDRHLQGLHRASKELGIDSPDLFMDPAYTRSSRMRISTSQVSCQSFSHLCFPPLQPDGYSCCYNIRKDDLILACSSFKSSEQVAASFRRELETTLLEMAALTNIIRPKL